MLLSRLLSSSAASTAATTAAISSVFRRSSAAAQPSMPLLARTFSTAPVPQVTGDRPKNVGILALDVYFPSLYVSQTELEKFDGVSAGKYVVGLGQKNMAVCNNSEDIISIALTAAQNLFEKYGISPKDIGRVEVGTETLLDKSKSVKTDLMRLFEASGNFDVEGVDNINACYGGTAAVLNAVSWVESSAWDGRYALVVCGDIAVYERGNARPTGGAAATAILIGPDAPLTLAPGVRSSYMRNAYDFYKPKLESEYPVVDGQLSIQCYYKAIDSCYAGFLQKLKAKTGQSATAADFDYFLLHSPFTKQVQKSAARLPYMDLKLKKDAGVLNSSEVSAELQPTLDLPYDATFSNKDFEKIYLKSTQKFYDEKLAPGVLLSEQLGNSYTSSLYTSLSSLVWNVGSQLDGRRVVLFSYGSGLASTMFMVEGRQTTSKVFSLDNIQRQLNLQPRLDSREKVSPEEFTQILADRDLTYGKPSFAAKQEDIKHLFPGTFYVSKVDDLYRRTYERV